MIDLYSDTMTRPTPAMREVIARAEVGDEQKAEDPTTARLEAMGAELLGCEHALYLPSATMSNAIALQLHCRAGDEILSAENGHVICFEGGGAAVHASAMCSAIPTPSGIFSARDLEERLRPPLLHSPQSRLVVVENTTNMGGGQPWPLATLDEVVGWARSQGLGLHLDGSRLLHAALAVVVPARRLTQGFETVTLCLSKGLGAPMGALLGFPAQWAERARRLKRLMGGGLRQSGMMAAAGVYALQHNVQRLAEDHRKAARLAQGLAELPGIRVESVELRTNMVFFHLEHGDSESFHHRLEDAGLRFSPVGGCRFRAVTHLDVSHDQIEEAIKLVQSVLTTVV